MLLISVVIPQQRNVCSLELLPDSLNGRQCDDSVTQLANSEDQDSTIRTQTGNLTRGRDRHEWSR